MVKVKVRVRLGLGLGPGFGALPLRTSTGATPGSQMQLRWPVSSWPSEQAAWPRPPQGMGTQLRSHLGSGVRGEG